MIVQVTPHIYYMASEIPTADRFAFDLNGYIVIRGVLSEAEVASANAAIDQHVSELAERTGTLRNTKTDSPLAGDGSTGRKDLAGMLGWPSPQRDVFRQILTHPRLVPYYLALLGAGYRMDHLPLLITQECGAEGFSLHGGPLTGDGSFNPTLQYRCVGGQMWNSLLAASVVLTDHNPGDGGFCVLRGSHKLNFPVPPDLAHAKDAGLSEHIYQPVTRAGDVVLFSEATVHGCLPWSSERQRRVALYRFAPATVAYGRSYHPTWPEAMLEGCTEAERAVLEPPYANRLDRPVVQAPEDGDGDMQVAIESRAGPKKDFDRVVFATKYF